MLIEENKNFFEDVKKAIESIDVMLEHEPVLNKIGQYIYIFNEEEKKKVDDFLKSIE
jgi:hypothetical protein